MRPVPNLNDEAAMLLRGKQSAIGAAKKEAAEELRDACTLLQSATWAELKAAAARACAAGERLQTLAVMWSELNEESK